jgi:hypothetical protein
MSLNTFRQTLTMLVTGLGLAGCAATQDVSDPNRITLSDAMVSTVDALSAANAESIKDKTNFGFYGCSVTAVFNVSATKTQDNKLALTASAPVSILPVTVGATGSSEATASGTRASTVTVVLDTKYCFPNAGGGAGTQKVGTNGQKTTAVVGPAATLPNPPPIIRLKRLPLNKQTTPAPPAQ